MATTHKANALMEAVAAELSFTLSALTQTRGIDGSGDSNPTLLIGAAAAGSTGAFILIKPVDVLATDILGNAAQRFNPHVIQVVLEANPAGGAGADVNSLATISKVLACVLKRGTRVEVYSETNGAAPGEADIVVGKLSASIDADIEKGILGNS